MAAHDSFARFRPYTLLACFAWQRRREVHDELVELLIRTIHNIGARAERRVVQVLLQDVRRIRGKNTILYKLSVAALAHPDGCIRDVLYPIMGSPCKACRKSR